VVFGVRTKREPALERLVFDCSNNGIRISLEESYQDRLSTLAKEFSFVLFSVDNGWHEGM